MIKSRAISTDSGRHAAQQRPRGRPQRNRPNGLSLLNGKHWAFETSDRRNPTHMNLLLVPSPDRSRAPANTPKLPIRAQRLSHEFRL